MTTVASRTFRSSPYRSASETWAAIVELLTQGRTNAARNELLAISGIASSVIADRVTRDAAIIVTCDGPRTRLYCIYDEDTIDGADANEDSFGFDPLQGDWRVSLPCHPEDLAWVQGALKKHTGRVTAREPEAAIAVENSIQNAPPQQQLTLDPRKFLGK